ncbi:hypothetical protein GIB67_008609 [Kingdonia uniflora]|uniref:Uncharacterized protein n=1 Tax=Kingdonia uniflora TaxID=39325 RepID=A0A7J7M541_9MAGN|nr:hypothetical protein GIB67_008609 [Kingdonia uniflora]
MDIGDDIYIAYYNRTGDEVIDEGFLCYLNKAVYGLSIPLTFFQKGVMNALKSYPGQLNGNFFEMMRVCEALNQKWRDGGIARQFIADDVLKYYKFKYVKDRKSGYLFSDSARPKFFDFESTGRPWYNHLVMVMGNCMQVHGEPTLVLIYKNFNKKPNQKGVADTSSLFDVVSREGKELNKVLGELGIRRDKRLSSVVEKVQRAHQNRAMATSGSIYADVMEIPTCDAGTSSSLVWRPRVKRTVSPSEKIAHVQTPQVGTEGVNADVNMAPPLKKQKQESGKDIRTSTKGVDLKAVEQEALDLAKPFRCLEVGRGGVEEEEGSAEGAVREGGSAEGKEDIDLALVRKYSEIIFPGDDASSVAEQSLTPPVADDTTKEEVVCLRGKVIELEKALSRASESINRTQQVHNKLKYERRLHKSNFDNTFKELFELQCRYGKIKIERDEVLRKESDRFTLFQKSLKNKQFADDSEKLECHRSLLSLTLHFEAEVDSERGLMEAYLELLTEIGIVSDPARVKFLTQEARNRHSIEVQRFSARAGVSIIWGGVNPLPDELDFYRGEEQ